MTATSEPGKHDDWCDTNGDERARVQWRDRGGIIANQQARITELETKVAAATALERQLWAESGDPRCGVNVRVIYRHICAQFREALQSTPAPFTRYSGTTGSKVDAALGRDDDDR